MCFLTCDCCYGGVDCGLHGPVHFLSSKDHQETRRETEKQVTFITVNSLYPDYGATCTYSKCAIGIICNIYVCRIVCLMCSHGCEAQILDLNLEFNWQLKLREWNDWKVTWTADESNIKISISWLINTPKITDHLKLGESYYPFQILLISFLYSMHFNHIKITCGAEG